MYIEDVFTGARKDAAEQVAYAKDLLARSETSVQGTIARTYLDEAQNRLKAINDNYAQFKAGNISPELQQAINRIKEGGIAGGAASTALSDFSGATGERSAENLGKVNLMNALDPSILYAVPGLAEGFLSGAADTARRLAEKAGVLGFKPTVQQDIYSAVDPYGTEWQTLADISAVSPIGVGATRFLGSKAFPGTNVAIRPSTIGSTPRIEPSLGSAPVVPSVPTTNFSPITLRPPIAGVSQRIEPIIAVPNRPLPTITPPASSPTINFSSVNPSPVPSASYINELGDVGRIDGVTRWLNDIRTNTPSALPQVANDDILRTENVSDWLRRQLQ